MSVSYKIVRFDSHNPAPVSHLSYLHTELLPESPVVLLGRRFMERFYYRLLPSRGLIFGAVAYVDGSPAGFVVATHDSLGFMRAGLRRWFFYLVWLVGSSLLAAPRSTFALWKAFRIMSNRQTSKAGQAEGEILSFGVLPPFREPGFVRQNAIKISNDLFEEATNQVLSRGVCLVRALVSSSNTPTKLFYSARGWVLRDVPPSGQQLEYTLEFVWKP